MFLNFDNNGRQESIITYYKSNGVSYPYYLKGDITAQLPSLKKKFIKYRDYAAKTMNEIFSEQLQHAQVSRPLSPAVFLSIMEMAATMVPLGEKAQFSPVYAVLAEDITRTG